MSVLIADRLLAWFDRHGRHDLPWQRTRDPYRIWIAEIMLQQTRVATVDPYYRRFIAELPDIASLAAADEDQVLSLWSGLGYYRRARYLHATARRVIERHGGRFPRDIEALSALPGIGRSTAAAILAQACGLRHAILDGNVKRVLARHRGIEGWPGRSQVANRLWQEAEKHTPAARVADYTQAIMDLGATLCTRNRPRCDVCPLRMDCIAHRDGSTDRLPTPAPRRVLPVRRVLLLIAHDAEGRVRLVRRPPTGIWPTLWSLPEIERAPGAHLRLDGFEHGFTHFRMQADICAVRLGTANVADAGDERLADRAAVADIALPAPVRSRLDRFWENEEWRASSNA